MTRRWSSKVGVVWRGGASQTGAKALRPAADGSKGSVWRVENGDVIGEGDLGLQRRKNSQAIAFNRKEILTPQCSLQHCLP